MRLSLILFALAASAQTPRFEVVSVKRTPDGLAQNRFTREPGGERISIRGVHLQYLIEWAYGIPWAEVEGAPPWATKDAFDIDAKAEGPSGFDDLRAMMRTLLAERFALETEPVTRQMPVYLLSVDPAGAKLTRHDPEDGGSSKVQVATERPLHLKVTATATPIGYFARSLRRYLDRPILDRTGLPGGYDLEFRFTMLPPANMPEIGHDGKPIDFGGPKLAQVLRDQFGLRLEPGKADVPCLRIRRLEQPNQN